jgi:hypothetical protein
MSGKIKVGQELYIVPMGNLVRAYGKDVRKGVVTKIGRKYLYVKIEGVYRGEDGTRFSKETLRSESNYGSPWIAFCSMQEIKDEEETSRLHDEFRQFFGWSGKSRELTLEQLRRIKAIIGEENVDR